MCFFFFWSKALHVFTNRKIYLALSLTGVDLRKCFGQMTTWKDGRFVRNLLAASIDVIPVGETVSPVLSPLLSLHALGRVNTSMAEY